VQKNHHIKKCRLQVENLTTLEKGNLSFINNANENGKKSYRGLYYDKILKSNILLME